MSRILVGGGDKRRQPILCCHPPTAQHAHQLQESCSLEVSLSVCSLLGLLCARHYCRRRGRGHGAWRSGWKPLLPSLGISLGHLYPGALSGRVRGPRKPEDGTSPTCWCPRLTWPAWLGRGVYPRGCTRAPVGARACVFAAETRHLPLAEVREPGASQWPGSGRCCAWVCPRGGDSSRCFLAGAPEAPPPQRAQPPPPSSPG